jgi:uncharacterized LabA/DUF88 family protein
MPSWPEPAQKRGVVFIDGQNLYHCARETFDAPYPNYDVMKLAKVGCAMAGAFVSEVHFYTGFPDIDDDRRWNQFWSKKLLAISRQGVKVFSRSLRYRNRVIVLSDGVTITRRLGEEKGIDVRIAIDLIRLAHRSRYDAAIVFSQDQDLSEVADEIKLISNEQERWIKMFSAFPYRAGAPNMRGINNTEWLRIDQATYEGCVDPFDYRTKKATI